MVTLGIDIGEGLRYAKGLKCLNATLFIRFGLMDRAVEVAGNLGICHIQEGLQEGDKKLDGVAFLTSSLEEQRPMSHKPLPTHGT